jgi:hypothetical protein
VLVEEFRIFVDAFRRLWNIHIQSLKMDLTEGSETSVNHNLTPGKYPKEHIQYVYSFQIAVGASVAVYLNLNMNGDPSVFVSVLTLIVIGRLCGKRVEALDSQ